MKRARFASSFLLLLGLSLLLPLQSFGQAVYGSIFGTVTDPTGAVIPNAKITVTDVRKGTSDVYTTNESGNYSATHLIPDQYKIKIEAQGFQTAESDNIQVSADSGAKFDAVLKAGSQSETVQVTAEAPQLKTDRSDIAVEFNQRYVEDLPLFNRNFTQLELLSPGTQKLVGWSHAATENPQGGQQIFVNGQHFSGTAFELDGTDNQDPILGIIVVNPNLDAITESKVALQNYDAEFGKAVAGVVTAQTKSGSNEFHGSAFWDRRTDATQARDPFTQFAPDKVTGRFIPSSRWNQFGGTVGGPIMKDKLFFFGDYQGTRQTSGVTNVLTIPTAQVLSTCLAATGFCDLSQYGPVIGNGKAGDPTNYIYDPTTGNSVTGAGRSVFCGSQGSVPAATCLPANANRIPVAAISPIAKNILKLFPQPTLSSIQNNFIASGSGPYNQNSFDTRVDYNASQSLQVFGRYSLDYFSLSGKPSLGTALGGVGFGNGPGLAGSSIVHNYSLASGFTKTLSATLLTDFRFGWFKYNPQTHKPDEGTTPANDFGIGSATGNKLNTNLATSGLPAFFMDNTLSNFGDGLNVARCNCPLTESEQQFQFVNNWTKISGNHQFKVGGDIRYAMNLRVPSDANRTGQLNFNHGITSSNGVGGGLDLATFLLGDVSFMDRYVSTSLNAAERQKRWFFYGQDTWRATPKLTINYGLRWEDYFPETVNGKGNGGFANIVEGVVRVAGYGPYGLDGNIGNATGAFAPRLGVAYQLKQNTVVRLGYGRSYDIGVFGSNFGHTVTQNLPVLVDQTISASSSPFVNNTNAQNNVIPAFTLAQGPPAYQFPAIPANGQLPLAGPDGTVTPKIRPVTQRLPTLDAWNATVQRQMTHDMSLEVSYVGNKGTHVFSGNGPSYNVNQPSMVGYGTLSQAQRRPFHNRFIYNNYLVPDPANPGKFIPLTCCDSDLGNYLGNDASSNYNALQVKVDKRFSHGLQFLTHYTWAHANNYDSNYFVDDPHVAYGPDDFNRNHVWVTNVVYELPFGRGKQFASGINKTEDYLIGGWQITNTSNWSSGLPFTPSTAECGGEQDVGVCRPNTGSGSFSMGAGSFDPVNHQVTYFTPLTSLTGPFADPGKGALGNVGRNSLHGPRLFTDDMALFKSFGITERVKGQFRMDAYNVFNHPVYGFSSTQGNVCIDCSGNAGKITNLEADTQMRQLQFGLKFTF